MTKCSLFQFLILMEVYEGMAKPTTNKHLYQNERKSDKSLTNSNTASLYSVSDILSDMFFKMLIFFSIELFKLA